MSGFLPGFMLKRQRVAHGCAITLSAFDLPGGAVHLGLASVQPLRCSLRATTFPVRAIPSPAVRSGSFWARPHFFRLTRHDSHGTSAICCARRVGSWNPPFSCTVESVCSGSTITLNRGSLPCSRNLSSRPSFPPASYRAVSPRTATPQPIRQPSAPLVARLLAQSSQMPLAAAKPRAPLSARLPGASLAASRACRPASDLTCTAAQSRGPVLTPRPFRAAARGGLFACHSAPARA